MGKEKKYFVEWWNNGNDSPLFPILPPPFCFVGMNMEEAWLYFLSNFTQCFGRKLYFPLSFFL
jgi:hypothetical protein